MIRTSFLIFQEYVYNRLHFRSVEWKICIEYLVFLQIINFFNVNSPVGFDIFCFCNCSYGWYFTFVQGFVYIYLLYLQGFTTRQMANPWKTYVKLSAVLMGSHGLTKGSLAFLNYPAQLMFKSTKVSETTGTSMQVLVNCPVKSCKLLWHQASYSHCTCPYSQL